MKRNDPYLVSRELINPTYSWSGTKLNFAAWASYKSWIALPGKVRLAVASRPIARDMFRLARTSRVSLEKRKGDCCCAGTRQDEF